MIGIIGKRIQHNVYMQFVSIALHATVIMVHKCSWKCGEWKQEWKLGSFFLKVNSAIMDIRGHKNSKAIKCLGKLWQRHIEKEWIQVQCLKESYSPALLKVIKIVTYQLLKSSGLRGFEHHIIMRQCSCTTHAGVCPLLIYYSCIIITINWGARGKAQ